jgi:hypothetical protein
MASIELIQSAVTVKFFGPCEMITLSHQDVEHIQMHKEHITREIVTVACRSLPSLLKRSCGAVLILNCS